MEENKADVREAIELIEKVFEEDLGYTEWDLDSRLIDYSPEYESDKAPKQPKAKPRFYTIWDKQSQRDMVCERDTGELMCLPVVCAMLVFETKLREKYEAEADELRRKLREYESERRRATA